jgi:hypothetical protein
MKTYSTYATEKGGGGLSYGVDTSAASRFPVPLLDVQADLVERHGIDTLLFCPNAWALRYVFLNPETVEEAARALTVFMRYLRRGSKGKGPHQVGAREGYPVEYFAVLERHSNFEENGFHWHLLLKGVDFIPYTEVIKPAWRSATHGNAEIGHIEAIRKPQVIGYVTKYLTKSLTWGEQGVRPVQRKRHVVLLDAQEEEMAIVGYDEHGLPIEEQRPYLYRVRQDEPGQVAEEQQVMEGEEVSRARRIRFSRHFFPEPVAELRARLFADLEQDAMEQSDNGKPRGNESEPEDDEQPVKRSSWRLVEQEEFTSDREEYKRRRRAALLDALTDLRTGQRELSRRVISVWAYQRSELRWSG